MEKQKNTSGDNVWSTWTSLYFVSSGLIQKNYVLKSKNSMICSLNRDVNRRELLKSSSVLPISYVISLFGMTNNIPSARAEETFNATKVCKNVKTQESIEVVMRPLKSDGDSEALFELTQMIGWSNSLRDITRLVVHSTNTVHSTLTLGFFENSMNSNKQRLVSTATVCVFGNRMNDKLGWVSYVMTHPEFRRQGLAYDLCKVLIDEFGTKQKVTLGLYASESGSPLYRKLGFVEDLSNGMDSSRLRLRSGSLSKSDLKLLSDRKSTLEKEKSLYGFHRIDNKLLLEKIVRKDSDLRGGYGLQDILRDLVDDFPASAWCCVEKQSGQICGFAFGRLLHSKSGVWIGPVWSERDAISAELVRRVVLSSSAQRDRLDQNFTVETLVSNETSENCFFPELQLKPSSSPSLLMLRDESSDGKLPHVVASNLLKFSATCAFEYS